MRLKDLSSPVLVSAIWNYLVRFGLYTHACISKTYFLEKAHYYFTRRTLYAVLKFLRKCSREGRSADSFKYCELPAFDCVIDFINRAIRQRKSGSFPQFLSIADETKLLELMPDFDYPTFNVGQIRSSCEVSYE